jgi:hypothetical protein
MVAKEAQKKLTSAHIRKIKETYHKKELDKIHSKIIRNYWADQRHKYNSPEYRNKLAKAKVGIKNPNSLLYKIRQMKKK